MRVAVTGGSGTIGRAVIEQGLLDGHGFVNIDIAAPPRGSAAESVPFVRADVTDYAALEKAMRDCEALIHLTAIGVSKGHRDHVVHHNNVVGSYNALRAAAEVGIRRVCQGSSVNAIGHAFSRAARYDYFPIDENHSTYNEDPYSLSKWICEQQAGSIARRYESISIASLRFHWVVADREIARREYIADPRAAVSHLVSYTRLDAAARACLLSIGTERLQGHEVLFIVAPDTASDIPSLEFLERFYPQAVIRGDLSGHRSLIDSAKAEKLLGWSHGSD